MDERLKRPSSVPEESPSYAQALKDIRNMLYIGAAGALSGPLTYSIATHEHQSSETLVVKMMIGFSIGVLVGLPAGRIFRL